MLKFYKKLKTENNILKTGYLDYKIFVAPELGEISNALTGENKRHIFVAYLDEKNPEMDAYIEKIISAAKIHLSTDCLLLKYSDDKSMPSLSQIVHKNTIQFALLFGISPRDFGLNITPPQYMPIQFNGLTFLFTDKLSVINASTEKRKALWDCIKTLFLD